MQHAAVAASSSRQLPQAAVGRQLRADSNSQAGGQQQAAAAAAGSRSSRKLETFESANF